MTCVTTNITECNFQTQLDETLEQLAFDFDFTLQDLCQAMGMSRTSLHRKITDCAGMSISIYIRNYRLNRALELLQTTNRAVSDIAYGVGFSNTAYFSRCFKAEFGQSATEIRQNNSLE